MHRILFSIGDFPIYTYGACLAVAMTCGLIMAGLLARRHGRDGLDIIDIGLISTVIGIIGARIGFVLQNLHTYMQDPMAVFNLRSGGITVIGAIIFGNLSLAVMCRLHKLSKWFCLDIYAAPLLLGMALGRIGCIMQGCCYGKVCSPDVLGAIVYPAEIGLGSAPRYPTPIYEMILDLILMAVCLFHMKRSSFQGQTFWISVSGYSLIRFITEFSREGSVNVSLSLAQWVCLGAFLLTIPGVFGAFGRPPLGAEAESPADNKDSAELSAASPETRLPDGTSSEDGGKGTSV